MYRIRYGQWFAHKTSGAKKTHTSNPKISRKWDVPNSWKGKRHTHLLRWGGGDKCVLVWIVEWRMDEKCVYTSHQSLGCKRQTSAKNKMHVLLYCCLIRIEYDIRFGAPCLFFFSPFVVSFHFFGSPSSALLLPLSSSSLSGTITLVVECQRICIFYVKAFENWMWVNRMRLRCWKSEW